MLTQEQLRLREGDLVDVEVGGMLARRLVLDQPFKRRRTWYVQVEGLDEKFVELERVHPVPIAKAS